MLTATYIQAQESSDGLIFYHISEKDGLTDNLVNCFFQDSRGIMWMGTQYGLNSFDGSVINTWHAGPTNNGLQSDQVNGIGEDKWHTLWISTTNGLSSYNPATKKIFTRQNSFDNYLHSLACDGDKVWIAAGSGLLMYDIVRQKFTQFVNNADKQPNNLRFNNAINNVFIDREHRLWLSTVNGVWLFDKAKHTFEQYDGPTNDADFDGMTNAVFEDHEGKLWVTTWNKGIKQMIPETRSVKIFGNLPGRLYHVMNMAEQKTNDGRYSLWLSDFLTEFKKPYDRFIPHELKPVAHAAALNPQTLYVSRDNLLWISTVKGVYILDPTRQLFKHYFITPGNALTDQGPALMVRNNQLWLGGDRKQFLKVYDDKFNVVKDYSDGVRAFKNYNQDFPAVTNIIPDGKNDLWLTTSDGILKMHLPDGKTRLICNTVTTDQGKITQKFFNNIFINDGKVWCFPWRRGVWEFNQKTNTFYPLVMRLPEPSGTLKNLNLQEAVMDSLHNIWFTDLDYGVVKYTASTQKFERIINNVITPYSRAIRIRYLKGRIWLINNTTVVSIDPKTNATSSWPLPNGMDKYVHDYTNDDDGNLWIAAKTGLVVFNTVNYSFNQYTEADGLINSDMDGALQKMPNGGMAYVGENYITSFKPAELLRTPQTKVMLLTGIVAGDSTAIDINHKPVTIPPLTSKVTFSWALTNYSNPFQNRYYGKLDKIDKDWNYAGNKGQIEYNSLPSGDYTFRYKAITSDGLISAEKSIAFTVEPPFWRSWWFVTLVLLLALACILLIIRNVRIKEQRKAAIQLQLSALEMKALRAQMNPHFIFNALNSIQECIVTKNTDAAYNYLSHFSKLVRMILENSEKQFITLADEVKTLRLYLSLEKLRFDDTFKYHINTTPQMDTSFTSIPAMIVQPFVENALWHGLIHKQGEKILEINFHQENDNLICVIEDNGVGRERSVELKTINRTKKQSMGMKITEERLHLLQTKADIMIEDLKDADGKGTGTKITITIPLQF